MLQMKAESVQDEWRYKQTNKQKTLLSFHMTAKESDIVIAKFDYKATDGQELDIQKGEKLTLQDDTQHWWKVMNAQGQVGYVPSNYVKRSKQGLFSSLRNTLGRRKSRSEAPPPVGDGPGTGGRPSKYSSPITVGGGNGLDASRVTDKASAESLSYVVPPTPLPLMNYQSTPQHNNSNHNTTNSSAANTFPPRPPSASLPPYTVSASLGAASRPNPPSFKYPQVDNRSPDSSSHNQMPVYPMYVNSNSRTDDGVGRQPSSQLNDQPPTQHWNANHTGSNSNKSWSQPPLSSSRSSNDNFNNSGNSASRQLCVARYAYTAVQPDELSFVRDDRVRVLEKSSDGWWHGILMTPDGQQTQSIGWFPSNYVTSIDSSKVVHRTNSPSPPHRSTASNNTATNINAPMSDPFYRAANSYSSVPYMDGDNNINAHFSLQRNGGMEQVLTLYAFNKGQIEELSFRADEVLDVVGKPEDDPDWWRCRNQLGEVGLVPRNYVRPMNQASMPAPFSGPLTNTLPPPQMSFPYNNVPAGPENTEDVRMSFASISINAGLFALKPWFWGNISRVHCEALLTNLAQVGEFIIRDSESHPGDLTVTMRAGAKNRNFKVHVSDEQYHIGQKMFSSVEIMIEHYRKHPIYKLDDEKHYLTEPFKHPNSGLVLRQLHGH